MTSPIVPTMKVASELAHDDRMRLWKATVGIGDRGLKGDAQ